MHHLLKVDIEPSATKVSTTGVDTRALTQKIREHGTLLGKLVVADTDPDSVPLIDPDLDNLVARVSCPAVRKFNRGIVLSGENLGHKF